jgi:hypothetical protein
VTVEDTTPPELTVPADIVAEATSAAGAVVTFAAAATDLVTAAPAITYSQDPGTVFALGTTTVTVTATDEAGNHTTKSFHVTVRDTTPPAGTIAIDGGADTTVTGSVTVDVSFTDAVGPVSMRFSLDGGATWTGWAPYGPTQGFILYGVNGVRTILAQVRDAAGNVGTASDSIMVAIPPPAIVVTGITPGQACDLCSTKLVTVTATAPVAAGSVAVSATLDGVAVTLPVTIDPFLLDAGDHTLRIVATDQYGRVSAQVVTFAVHATIEGLICAVQRAVAEGLVASNLGNSLLVKLYAARASRDRGNRTPEANQLEAFVHELAAQRGKKIVPAFSDRATGWTEDLIARVESGKA